MLIIGGSAVKPMIPGSTVTEVVQARVTLWVPSLTVTLAVLGPVVVYFTSTGFPACPSSGALPDQV